MLSQIERCYLFLKHVRVGNPSLTHNPTLRAVPVGLQQLLGTQRSWREGDGKVQVATVLAEEPAPALRQWSRALHPRAWGHAGISSSWRQPLLLKIIIFRVLTLVRASGSSVAPEQEQMHREWTTVFREAQPGPLFRNAMDSLALLAVKPTWKLFQAQ